MSLLLVGVGHVFNLGDAIRSVVAREQPEIVALELDPERYRGLLQRQQGQAPAASDDKRLPKAYRALAKFQESVAESYGVQVGSEMVAALEAARLAGAEVALVDRPAEQSVRRLWQQMGILEKIRLLWSGVSARFGRRRGQNIEAELQRYQSDPTKYLDELGRQFPTVKRVLLTERDEYMAGRLRDLSRDRRVVAFVGDGHVDGLVVFLRDLDPRTLRLRELRSLPPSGPTLGWRLEPGGDRVAFSFVQRSLEGTVRRA